MMNLYRKNVVPINHIIDTSEIFSEQDLKDIKDIESIKKALSAYLDTKEIVKEMIRIISENEYVNFKNERAKKFIDYRKPSFNVVVDLAAVKASDKYGKSFKRFSNEKDEVNFYSTILNEELMTAITDFIYTSVKVNKSLFDTIVSKEIFKDYENDEEGLKSILSIITTIFGVRFTQNDKSNAIIEMML